MIDLPQTFAIALEVAIALMLIAVIVGMRMQSASQSTINETQRQIGDSLRETTRTLQSISQMQREQTAVLQQLITQIAVMEAKHDGQRPNE